MTVQLAVRLPVELVEFVDGVVASGGAASRAAVVTTALERELRRSLARRDAELLQEVVATPIYIAQLDMRRPVVVLPRELVRPLLAAVTVAPITTTIRGLSTEVSVGPSNGIDAVSVISCDNISTIPVAALREQMGFLLPSQEPELCATIVSAFDLET